MKKNNIWMIIVVAAIVALISSIMTSQVLGSLVSFGPPYLTVKEKSANDCSADEMCETESISTGKYDYKIDRIDGGQMVSLSLNKIIFEVKLDYVDEQRNYAIFDIQRRGSPNQQRVSVAPGETYILNNDTGLEITNLGIDENLRVDFMMNIGSGIKVEESINSKSWKGVGKGYACLDEVGSIYRSNNPCI